MKLSPTIMGLALDIVGFVIIFLYGGFAKGQSVLLLQSNESEKTRGIRILGAILVIAGFGFQIFGAL